ncbi:MAG: hypothetical protein PHF44_04240, partial [Candidatus Pacebacteria bacterium]|nr:hypothetical protein [Candidatus Paceibacterota bacterium]
SILSDNRGGQGAVNTSGEAQIIHDDGSHHSVTDYKFSRSENGEIQVNSTENYTIEDWGYNCTKTFEIKCLGRKDYN